ncbi:MAG: PKD domain-containing protein, partial [Acidobacteriota bacterium]
LFEGSTGRLEASFFDGSGSDTFTATVDWGDGSPLETPTVSATADGGAFTATHHYAQHGTYPGEVCVTDGSGATRCEDHDFAVSNVAPRRGWWLDLNEWTVSDFRGTNASDWRIGTGTAFQANNSSPTALLAPFQALGTRVSGTWRAWSDNGYMGFVFGYEPGESETSNADYLILVWKKDTSGNARRGIRLYRVSGVVSSFWNIYSSPEATLLAEATTLGNSSYVYEWEYEFHVELLPDRFRLWIEGGLEIDVTDDFSGLDGAFGLYNHSQQRNIFSRLRVQPADATTDASTPLAPFFERYDFRDFTEEEDNTVSATSAVWATEMSGRMVKQRQESRPSFFYSPDDINFRPIEGTLRVEGDDGFIGMALGFEPGDASNPDADYILVVWKQHDSATSERGLKAYHVQG